MLFFSSLTSLYKCQCHILCLFPVFLHLSFLFIILLFAFLNWSRFLHQPLFRKPLQLYSCQWLNAAKPFSLPADPSLAHPQPVSNVSPTKVSFPPILPPYLNSLPIALHKGKHGCISHPIICFIWTLVLFSPCFHCLCFFCDCS